MMTEIGSYLVMQHAFVIIKPDATAANNVGNILYQLESVGFEISRIEKKFLQDWQVKFLYREHLGKDFFERHFQFMLSGKVVAVGLYRSRVQSQEAADVLRHICGNTDPSRAGKDTIRGMYGTDLPRNAIHFSDTEELAMMEANLIFNG